MYGVVTELRLVINSCITRLSQRPNDLGLMGADREAGGNEVLGALKPLIFLLLSFFIRFPSVSLSLKPYDPLLAFSFDKIMFP